MWIEYQIVWWVHYLTETRPSLETSRLSHCSVQTFSLEVSPEGLLGQDADPIGTALWKNQSGSPIPLFSSLTLYAAINWPFCFRIQGNPRSCMIKRCRTGSVSLPSQSPRKYKANGQSTVRLKSWYHTASWGGCCEHFYSEVLLLAFTKHEWENNEDEKIM